MNQSLASTFAGPLLATATPREFKSLAWRWDFWARPDQLPPKGIWRVWLILAGHIALCIGLAIVKTLVDLHVVSVYAASEG